ncbi:MAG: hypothetical protein ACKPE6_15520, partial [Gammaproteobacteria bacterium]
REALEVLQDADRRMQALQAEWESFTQEAEKPRREVGVQQASIRQLEESMAQAVRRIEQLSTELAELDTRALEEERAIGEERVLTLEEANADWQSRAESARATITERRQAISGMGADIDATRGQLQEQRGRFASLTALQQAALGQTDENVSGWISAQQLPQSARVAERIRVAEGWETAVETVLGRHLEAVFVPDIAAMAPSLGAFGGGTLGLYSPRGSQSPAAPGTLLAQVRADFDLGDLLGGVYVAGSIGEALAARERLGRGESVITADGIWLGRDWLRIARDADPRAGVIRRSAELAELEQSIEMLRERELDQQAAQEDAQSALREAEAELLSVQQSQREAAARYTEARSALSACTARLEQMTLRLERSQAEAQQYRERHESLRLELQSARGLLEAALDAMHRDTARREELLSLRESSRIALDAARARSRESREQTHRLAMRREALTAQTGGLRGAIARLTTQFAGLEARSRQLGEQIAA